MIISLIAAMGKNRAIGKNNSLPWSMPADLKYFMEKTKGKTVIMGRKTFESIGKPLPNRKNIIITRDKNYKADGYVVAYSIDDALNAAKSTEEVMVIGGANIYAQFLPKANRIYLTIIKNDFEGDAFFPKYGKEWKERKREECKADKNNKYDYVFLVLEK